MSNYSVSVVITCFNNSSFIQQCIKSVLAQKNIDVQIIIVDDCSTDNSVTLIKDLCKINSCCILWQNKTNIGVACSRNKGLSMATKPFITFLDGDDYYINSSKLFNEIHAIHLASESQRNHFVSFSPHLYVDSYGKPLYSANVLPHFLYNRLFFLLRLLYLPRDFVCSTQLVRSIGGYNESQNLYEDWDFKIRLISKAHFILSTPLLCSVYRKHLYGLSKRSKFTLFTALNFYFRKNCTPLEYFILFPLHVISFFFFSPVSSLVFKLWGMSAYSKSMLIE